ncbi:serine hydrolase domain-containing protein, partial [Corynebacterium durum]|uniref:serine hydrolase domain-containing protein n=1 Tax=Corynebacterium durum TaxID=61592 RepID=UPI00288A4830
MKALISLLGVILAMAFMASPAHAQSHENDRYQKLADDLKAPGLAVVTFDANGVTDEHYVGVDSNSNPIGPDSLFIWGSISKSFTSALAMMLAEQGKIDLNAPLTRYYPEFQGTALGNNGATVTDLIHHTAGLPRELNPYPHNLQSVIDGVKDLPSVDPVGTHSYSNISYILLQQLIERATGESYSTLLETYVDPATGVTPLSRAATINSTVPAGYAPFFTGNLAVREPIQDYEIGEGNLAGTGRQLADYGAWLLRQHQAGQLPSTLPKVSTT